MKEKTSVTLAPDILLGIDRLAGTKRSRSAVIEDILRRYIREQIRAERRSRDLAILNKYADELNADAEDGLEDQSAEEE